MKPISIRISVDDEPVGAFTLDPLTTVQLLAHAKVNPQWDFTRHVSELIRFAVSGEAYALDHSREMYAPNENDVLTAALETCSARELAALNIPANIEN
jgi:hypothetical protein